MIVYNKIFQHITILLMLLVVCWELRAQEKRTQPNIIFILADDLGWADLSCYGNQFNESPNIDKLARHGIRFTDAYSASPVCSPARASILSGQYPARTGIIDFIPGHWRPHEEVVVPMNRTQYLPTEIVTVAETLQKVGYATGYFGKWHLGDKFDHHPINQGFDEANVGVGYYNVKYSPPRESARDKISSEQLADFATEFIARHKAHPFFLFVSYFDVHVPYNAKEELIEKYLHKPNDPNYPCNAVYAASIEQMDQSVGRVVRRLEKMGLLDNTLIVFMSDNGGSVSENKYPNIKEGKFPVIAADRHHVYAVDDPLQYIGTANTPLRNEKGSVYEGGIRVPMIVSWSGRIKGETVRSEPVTTVDLYPTFVDVAGTTMPETQVADGLSLKSLFFGETITRDYIYWHYPVYHHDVPAAAIRNNDWKLIRNLVTNSYVLYNLKVDISESTDLSDVYPHKADELAKKLSSWQQEVKAPFPIPNADFNEEKRFIWGTHPTKIRFN